MTKFAVTASVVTRFVFDTEAGNTEEITEDDVRAAYREAHPGYDGPVAVAEVSFVAEDED